MKQSAFASSFQKQKILVCQIQTSFVQAAASGQKHIKFVPEDKTQDNAAREDIQGMFFDDDSYQWRHGFPGEGKDQWGCQKPDRSGESHGKGILENEEGIGKVR